MNLITTRVVWTGDFLLGGADPDGGPRCFPETVSIVEDEDGRRYVKTSQSFMPALHGDDRDLDDLVQDGRRGYYATREECMASFEFAYPHWREAAPIMDELFALKSHGGYEHKLADRLDISPFRLHALARGARKCSKKEVLDAVKRLAASKKTGASH